ncbi:MAG: ATP-binding protein [Candidatus Limnocylindrales bacterium]|jgi:signal transduction histidine kinase
MVDRDSVIYDGLISDITERRALQEQLRQAQKMEAVGRLAGGVAHDFNNLLTAVRGYAELARAALRADDPARADIEEVIVAADRASELTSQLLAFSRRQVLQPQVLDAAAATVRLAPMLRRLLGEHIELNTGATCSHGRVKVDPGQLEQVVVNLAVNARDAMGGGGRLTIETADVELDTTYASTHPGVPPGPYVMLTVSDTGSGMDADTRARAFEPFFTTKEPGKGTGMGLATVCGIVKQSGGSISLCSEPGKGTTFRLYFPRVDEPASRNAGSDPPSPSPSGSETVLLVEDDPGVRGFARRTMTAQGYVVLEASSGADALALADGHADEVDLLVTDLVMPGIAFRCCTSPASRRTISTTRS